MKKAMLIIVLISIGGAFYYQHSKIEKARNQEFAKFIKEVADPQLEINLRRCLREVQRTWCEAEAWQIWGKWISQRKKEIWNE